MITESPGLGKEMSFNQQTSRAASLLSQLRIGFIINLIETYLYLTPVRVVDKRIQQ